MSLAVTEIKGRNGWTKVGLERPGESGGSFTDNSDGERYIYLVTAHSDHVMVERSIFGVDAEMPDATRRMTASLGWSEVAKLGPGQEWEKQVKTDSMNRRHALRVRCVAEHKHGF